MDPEQVGAPAGAECGSAGSVGNPGLQTPQVLPESCSSPGRQPESRGRPSPQGPRAGRSSRIGGGGVWSPGPVPSRSRPPAGSTHVSLHERPHEAAVHGSSGRARQRSAPPRPAQRAHGPGPECGRAPPPRSRPGRTGRCGGWPRPLSAHARPGPRRPARWWPLRGGGRAPGLLEVVGLRAESAAARADPAAALLLCSAPLFCSPPLSSRVLCQPPSRFCLWPPVPACTSRARVSMRPAARGPRPGTLALAHLCTRASGPSLPLPVPAPRAGVRRKPWGGGRRAAGGSDSLLLPPPGRSLCS